MAQGKIYFLYKKKLYGVYSEEMSGQHKLTLAIKCLPKNKGPLEGPQKIPLDTLSALFKNPYSMYSGMCFLGVHVLRASIRHH